MTIFRGRAKKDAEGQKPRRGLRFSSNFHHIADCLPESVLRVQSNHRSEFLSRHKLHAPVCPLDEPRGCHRGSTAIISGVEVGGVADSAGKKAARENNRVVASWQWWTLDFKFSQARRNDPRRSLHICMDGSCYGTSKRGVWIARFLTCGGLVCHSKSRAWRRTARTGVK
jgi:hypothetical protein